MTNFKSVFLMRLWN